MLSFLGTALRTLRIALPKVAVGWMFALLTIDFNRVAVVEFGIAAVLVTSLLSIHYFLAPFQVVAGRIADCFPVLGFRRTPYLIGASVVASLLFLTLPGLAESLGTGGAFTAPLAVITFVAFGLCMAVIADSYHSLIAENTPEDRRPTVIAVVWIVMILSTIAAAVVMNAVRPTFSIEAMERLYGLTPFIVIGSVLLGVIGIEKRLDAAKIAEMTAKARRLAPPGNPIASAVRLIRSNAQAARFFAFISFAIFGLFLQESLIEILGAEVFSHSVKETTRYQPIWGAGVLLGMLLMGAASAVFKPSRRRVTLAGCTAAVAGFVALAVVVFTRSESLLLPTLFALGLCAGIFNVGALALMMDMTVDGATGLYMGIWGSAQAMGMGLSSVAGGALHSGLINTGLLNPPLGYALIFVAEASLLGVAALCLRGISIERFRQLAGQNDKAIEEGRMGDYVDVLRGELHGV